MNKVILRGNLGGDPELRYTASNKAYCKFSLAVPQKKGQHEVYWIPITAWGKVGENCAKYLGKGSHVLLEGIIVSNKWRDQSGKNRTSIEVWANEVDFLPSRSGQGGEPSGTETDGDDPPF
jgi:single-strand DNA-binding protein